MYLFDSEKNEFETLNWSVGNLNHSSKKEYEAVQWFCEDSGTHLNQMMKSTKKNSVRKCVEEVIKGVRERVRNKAETISFGNKPFFGETRNSSRKGSDKMDET